MKRIALVTLVLTGLALTCLMLFGLTACRPPRDRSDWRAPAGIPRACTSDADCPAASACAIELGASQGTCSPDPDGGPQPYGPRDADGGPALHRPPGPPINVQPGPGDINL